MDTTAAARVTSSLSADLTEMLFQLTETETD